MKATNFLFALLLLSLSIFSCREDEELIDDTAFDKYGDGRTVIDPADVNNMLSFRGYKTPERSQLSNDVSFLIFNSHLQTDNIYCPVELPDAFCIPPTDSGEVFEIGDDMALSEDRVGRFRYSFQEDTIYYHEELLLGTEIADAMNNCCETLNRPRFILYQTADGEWQLDLISVPVTVYLKLSE